MGNIIFTVDNYSIYQNKGYYMCVSNQDVDNYQLFIGFSEKELGLVSNHVIIDEIRKISDLLFSVSKNVVYVVPVINPDKLKRLATINEDKEYDNFLNKEIFPITSDVKERFSDNKKSMNDVIGFIKQREFDKKIIDGIDMSVSRVIVSKGGTLDKDYIKSVELDVIKKYNGIDTVDFLQTDDNIFIQESTLTANMASREIEARSVKKLTRINNKDGGFSSMSFIILVITVSTLFIGSIIYLILK